jgi:hypothetical protein
VFWLFEANWRTAQQWRTTVPTDLEFQFHEAMLTIHHRARAEAKYNATIFLQMVSSQGGLQAARTLINSPTVSSGYTALWERGRLDLTVEAMILAAPRYHGLFTEGELAICKRRLESYGYKF